MFSGTVVSHVNGLGLAFIPFSQGENLGTFEMGPKFGDCA